MKAILLAGGQGSRMWPLCVGNSKTTAPLLGEPVVIRAIRQLAKNGVTQVLVTLREGDEALPACLAAASDLDIEVICRPEERHLGTAGAVRACADLVGDEDFWVVCGDVVWDFDLAPVLALHRARGAAATLAVAHSDHPERCGAAAWDGLGRVTYFEEKPPLTRCESVAVSTGLTLCSPRVLEELAPSGDLARSLFPRLLDRQELWAAPVEGHWRDVGAPGDLLLCAAELLSGRTGQRLSLPQRRPGIYAADPLPVDVDFVPPCWIGPGVTIGSGSLIGPHAVLEEGSVVGSRSLVQRTLIDGGEIGSRATAYGTVVGRGVRTGSYCVLNEGTAVGPDAVLGDNVVLMEGVRVAPGAVVPAATRLSADHPPHMEGQVPAFSPTDGEDWKKSLYFL